MAGINPHVDGGKGYAPLSDLMSVGLMIFGDNNIDMADGALAHLLLYFANNIVSEVNIHPYRTGKPLIQPYSHPAEVREIPDAILIDGIAAFYAGQQQSQKAPLLMAKYYQTMNRLLWMELNGNTKIEARIFDKGPTNETNGTPL